MKDYYVSPSVRAVHQAYMIQAQWDMVNTLSPDYPDLMAIKNKYPDISVGEANAMIKRNAPSAPTSLSKPSKEK